MPGRIHRVLANQPHRAKKDLRWDVISASGAYAYWPMDRDLMTMDGANAATAFDMVSGRQIAFPSSHRPALVESDLPRSHLLFTGTEYGTETGAGLLSGKDGATVFWLWRDAGTATDYQFLLVNGPTSVIGEPGRFQVFADVGSERLSLALEGGSSNFNWWQMSNALAVGSYHCYALRGKFSDGATAAKVIRDNRVPAAGIYTMASDVSGQTISNNALKLCHWGGIYTARGQLTDVVVAPYLSDADADSTAWLLLRLRGLI